MDEIEGRRVLVTGGSAGIGAATVRVLVERGARVAALGRSQRRLAEVAAATGAVAITADVADAAAVASAVGRVARALGGMDAVVNNAGLMLHSPPSAGDTAAWDAMLRVNVLGLLHVTHAALPHLEAAGHADVVNIGSVAAAGTIVPDFTLYSATKAAVERVTEGLRMDLGRRGIRVSLLTPGVVRTDGFGPGIRDRALREKAEHNKRQRGLDPRHVAEQVAYLLSLPTEVSIHELVVERSFASMAGQS